MTSKILILFHASCMDGFGSAHIARNFFGPDRVELMPVAYNQPIPDLKDRIVYLLDFSYKPEILYPAALEAKAIVMLDHHIGSWEDWEGKEIPENMEYRYVADKSGVGITWDFFHPHTPMPSYYTIMQDYDLWDFKFLMTREIMAGMMTYGYTESYDFDSFDVLKAEIDNQPGDTYTRLIAEGITALRLRTAMIKGILQRCTKIITFAGTKVPLVNIAHEMVSQAGEMLSKDWPFVVMYEDRHAEGVRKYSLRSRKGGGVNVKSIAKLMGGSGHENAAGFTIDLSVIESTSQHAESRLFESLGLRQCDVSAPTAVIPHISQWLVSGEEDVTNTHSRLTALYHAASCFNIKDAEPKKVNNEI